MKYAFGILKDNKNAWIFSLRESYIIRREKLLKCTRNFYWIVSYNWNRRAEISAIVFLRTQREYWIWFPFGKKERAANFLCQKQFYSFGSLLKWNKRWICDGWILTFSIEDWGNVRIGNLFVIFISSCWKLNSFLSNWI